MKGFENTDKIIKKFKNKKFNKEKMSEFSN